jgi:antitoxin VapB
MALYIRDPEIDSLVEEAQRLTKAPTKTETVKHALRKEIERAREQKPLRGRLEAVITMADKLGPSDPNFDMKTFSDTLYEGT